MKNLKLDAVSKEELLQALIYMASQYLESSTHPNELEHLFMSAGEETCEVLAKVGAIDQTASGGKWRIDPWGKLGIQQTNVTKETA
jgi:hypothetical protein